MRAFTRVRVKCKGSQNSWTRKSHTIDRKYILHTARGYLDKPSPMTDILKPPFYLHDFAATKSADLLIIEPGRALLFQHSENNENVGNEETDENGEAAHKCASNSYKSSPYLRRWIAFDFATSCIISYNVWYWEPLRMSMWTNNEAGTIFSNHGFRKWTCRYPVRTAESGIAYFPNLRFFPVRESSLTMKTRNARSGTSTMNSKVRFQFGLKPKKYEFHTNKLLEHCKIPAALQRGLQRFLTS